MLRARWNDLNTKRTDGFFLVGVLVFCFILIPAIAVFSQSSRTIAKAASSRNQRFKIEFLASGFMDAIASRLTWDQDLSNRLRETGSMDCRLGKLTLRFRAQDHDGKVDLNYADGDLLIVGFKAAGLSDENAALLQQYAEAFRSNSELPDTFPHVPQMPSLKHAPFERVEELNDAVAALKLAPIDFADYFTIFKRVGNVEYATAPKALKDAIDVAPDIKEQFANDNGDFGFIDIATHVITSDNRDYAFRSTYARSAIVGEVQQIDHESEVPADPRAAELSKHALTSCQSVLGIQGEFGPHV